MNHDNPWQDVPFKDDIYLLFRNKLTTVGLLRLLKIFNLGVKILLSTQPFSVAKPLFHFGQTCFSFNVT